MSPIERDRKNNADEFAAIVEGRHGDPFAVLGPHRVGNTRFVRTFQPKASSVDLVDTNGDLLASMERVHPDGLFVGIMPPRKRRYALHCSIAGGSTETVDDPYRFTQTLGDLDLYLMGEGSDQRVYEKLGAWVGQLTGVRGTRFTVWAPNASRVAVVGDFNDWDGRSHVMRLHPGNGIWEIFIPSVRSGDHYKYELLDRKGKLLPLKSDPFGRFHEPPPGNASVVYSSTYRWQDHAWMQKRRSEPALNDPISIYEVHLGSWRRKTDENNRFLTYRELAEELLPYVSDLGFTHLELMPVSEHPFDGSWGYQPVGMFSPTHRFGEPDDFRFFVDRCHDAGLSVILDWVPAHFPRDEHGLRRFDGTALYEHADKRKGEHADWGTLIFNYGRREVVNYLIGSALFWIEEYHIDGIRVDAVASMLYLDYSRKKGEWLPNKDGGNENLEAVDFIKRLNVEIHAHGATSYAEESTAWPAVSRPVEQGGLGFTFKWNMGWMNDTLSYMSEDSVHRKYHHDKLTFGIVYAFTENFVLPLSHDEVVHGKRSLLGRMPGDDWQRFANLRAYYANMFAHPGKKLLFMGSEIAQSREWSHDQSLDWHLLEYAAHQGVQVLVKDLNELYRNTPALYEVDFNDSGFEWLDWQDRKNSVIAWLRRDLSGGIMICVSNFTPVVRESYRVGVPDRRDFLELLNTDDLRFGGSGITNPDIKVDSRGSHGRSYAVQLSLPPLATIILGEASK